MSRTDSTALQFVATNRDTVLYAPLNRVLAMAEEQGISSAELKHAIQLHLGNDISNLSTIPFKDAAKEYSGFSLTEIGEGKFYQIF